MYTYAHVYAAMISRDVSSQLSQSVQNGRQSNSLKTTRTMMSHREIFDKYVRGNFLQAKVSSKTISCSKGDRIVACLTGRAVNKDAHFRFWVKSREFKLMDYPTLGLKNIVCIPAKAKVGKQLQLELK